MNRQQAFPKTERLCSQKVIDTLFRCGHRFIVFPWAVTWMVRGATEADTHPVQLLVVAPKSMMRHAVDRNRAKRQMRELYRTHKTPLYDFLQPQGLHLVCALRYVSREHFSYAVALGKYQKLIDRLLDDIRQQAALSYETIE